MWLLYLMYWRRLLLLLLYQWLLLLLWLLWLLLLLLSLFEPSRDTVKPRGNIYRINRSRGVNTIACCALYELIHILKMTAHWWSLS